MIDHNGFGAELLGKTLKEIVGGVGDEEMMLFTDTGEVYKMLHYPDCYKSVEIQDICGDIDDLIGSPILLAEEVESTQDEEVEGFDDYGDDSHTWTFYKLSTIKGAVTIRWLGESNGYYSESVDFVRMV